jgi:small subunit ribosomal protein S4e
MSNHQKRLSAPDAWPVSRKTETFTVDPSAGPHGDQGVPLLIVLRDVLGYADSRKEARYALDQDRIRINGDAVSDERRPVGLFDIVSFGERDEHYRVFPGTGGRLALTPIPASAADSRLGRIVGKRQVAGGDTQVTLHDGATLLLDGEDATPGDSLIVDIETNEIVARFPYEEGSLVTAVDGRHAGEIGRIESIDVRAGSNPNAVSVETADGGFETVEEYVVVIDEAFVDDPSVLPGHEGSADESESDAAADTDDEDEAAVADTADEGDAEAAESETDDEGGEAA